MTQSTARAGTSARMDALTWAMLVLLSIVWGGSFFFVGVAVKEITPLTLVLARVGIAAIALLAYVALIGVRTPLTRDVLIAFVGMAILNNVIPFTAIVSGQTQIASGLASILNSTTPIFTVVFANLLTDDEKLTSAKLAGVLLGVAGVAALMGPAAFAGLTDTIGGLALILVAACSYGFASIWGRRFRRLGVPAAVAATGQLCASTLLLIPLVLLIDQPWTLPMPSAATVWSIIGLALASTAFAYILFFRILQTAGATNISLVTLLVPVSAIILGAVFLDEALSWTHFLGMALIAAGLACIDGRLLPNKRPASRRDA